MKKFFIAAAFIMVLLASAICVAKVREAVVSPEPDRPASSSPAPEAVPTLLPISEDLPVVRDKPMSLEAVIFLGRNKRVAEEKETRYGMAGRLVIPGAGIDVALFTDGIGETEAEKRQAICDAQDSAALFNDGAGDLIGDHNNQAFALLGNVQLGDKAFILRGHSILSLECNLVMTGHNYGQGIVDDEGCFVSSYTDYICYTCEDSWNNVSIVGFSVVDEDYVM